MNRRAILLSLVIMAAFFFGRSASAQGRSIAEPEPGSELHVYLVTFGPGDDPWEKFGHNALQIVNDYASDDFHDVLFHWGAFQFGNNFVWHFVQGKLDYQMALSKGEPTFDYYGDGKKGNGPGLNRDIRQQALNLTNAQKLALRDALYRNYGTDDKHPLRTYRYDYYNDNCSTRVRDAIDNIVDHRLKLATQGKPTGTTFRFHTDRLDCHTLWLYVALQGVLGQSIDRPIDRWQEMFLPDKVHDRVNELRVMRDGKEVPLVLSDVYIYKSDRVPEPVSPPMMAPWLLGAGLIFGGIFAGLGRVARRRRLARWAFVLVTTPWLLLMGLGGGLIIWAWAATDHVVARHNENVLQVSILALPLLVMLPMLAFGKRRGAILTQRLIFLMVALSALGLLLKILPWFYQVNWSIISMCLPANLGLAYAAWVMAKSPAPLPARKKAASSRV